MLKLKLCELARALPAISVAPETVTVYIRPARIGISDVNVTRIAASAHCT